MKTLYIFIAAGGPAGGRGGVEAGRRRHNAGRRRARADPAAGPEHACPREWRGGAGRRGASAGSARRRSGPRSGRGHGPAPRCARSSPGGRPDSSSPAPGVRRATVGSASRPRATLGKPPSEGMSSGRRSAAPWVPVGRSPGGAGWRRRRGVAPAPLPDPPGVGPRTPGAPPGPRNAAVRPAGSGTPGLTSC